MGWRPVRDIAHAVCVHRFEATEQHDLALDIGDDVYITELGGTNHDWCRGWLLAQPSVLAGLTSEKGQSLKPRAYAGIFPRNCVRIREILADERERNGEDGGSSRPDTADTVAGALRSPASTLSRTASSKRSTYPSSLAKRRSLAVRPRMKQLYLRPEDTLARDPEAEKEQAPLPALKIGDTTAVSSHEPLVDEISSCLHEWHSTKVHELMLNQEYELLERVTALVKRLDEARKQFVHDLLTDKELEDLRERTIWDLVDGNKMLDGEVIVRSPTEKGRIFTSQDSIPEMLQLQAMMSLRNKPLKPPSKRPHLFHVLVDVKNFPWPLDDTATLHMYICHQQFGERPRPVSEVYAVDLPLRGPGEDLPERTPKTLFVNLTKADVGTVSDSSSRLFLICKLQRDEPIRSGVRNEAVPGQLPSEWADEVMSPSGSLRGRRSFLFGGQKARKESSRRPSFSDGRPTTEESFMRSRLQRQQSDALVTDRSSENQSRPSTIERKVRRVVGYSALDISSVVLDVGQAHHSLSLWTPAPPSIDTDEQKPDGEGDGWHDVLNFICRNAVGHFAKALSLNSFDIDIHTFAHIDVDTLVKETPALLRDVYRTPTLALLGGSELTRSDVYLTLKEPVLPSNARFFHPKEGSVPIRPDTEYRNLQLTFEVRTYRGERIDHAIYPTANRPPHTAYRIPAIDRGEAWNQTIRFTVPPEELRSAHVVMSIADGAQFPFALAWIPLGDQQFASDGPTTLAFWDYSEFTASTVNGRGAYQALPFLLSQFKSENPSIMAALNVELLKSSTTTTGNQCLLDFLRVENLNERQLPAILEDFKTIPDVELIKFVNPILSNIYEIFYKVDGFRNPANFSFSDDVAKASLMCLVHVLHLTHDRRFSGFEDFVGKWATKRRRALPGSIAILKTFRQMFADPYDPQDARDLRSALKVSGDLMRIALHSEEEDDETPSDDKSALAESLMQLINVINAFIKTPRDVLLGSQSMLLHNFASWLESFRPVMTFDAILATANEVVRATHESRAKLRMHGLVMIRALSDPEVYDDVIRPGSMVWLANCTADWLEPYWLGSIRRMICPEDVDALRLCCSIVKAQLPQSSAWRQIYIPRLLASYRILLENPESLHAADHSRLSRRNMLSELFPTTYPFHMIEIDTGSPPQEVKLEMIALLATFLQEGKPSIDVLNEHGSADPKMSMLALVTDAFQVLESVQKGSAYPRQWLSFSITEKKHQVVMLEWILDVLITEFLPDADNVLEFDDQIWARWLDLIMSLASSEAISIENFSDQKQRAVWTIGKDIRQEAADLLFRAWTALGWESTSEIRQLSGLEKVGGYQVQFTTRFMQPIVKLCMCLHHGLRTAAAQILWAMVVSEWELNGNLDVVQTAISSAFDTICRETSSSRNKMPHPEFLNDMSKRGEFTPGSSEESFHEAFLRMKQHLDHLWELLVAAHGPATDSASRLVNAIAAAHFLQDSNPEAYIRHLHDVADLHYRARHYSSAGLALGLHAELYDWDLFKNLEAMLDLRLPAESAFARKERLYGAMIRHFELGQCYEKAFPAMQELIGQYTTNAYNFDKAAKAQERLSRMYDALHTGAGYQVPRYFLVAFHGSDFPQMLAEKRFVYEGAIDDDTRSFRRKLQEQFPYASARLDQQPHTVNGVDHSQEPYMVISSVSPLKDYAHPVNLRTGVSPYTREYQLISGPRQFAITRRGNDLHRDITDQEVRKTVFTCASAFPTLMSREAVIDVEERTLSPLQAAVDRTHRKTMSLAHSLQEAKSGGDDEPWRKLVAAVRASVEVGNGSVLRYRDLLREEDEGLAAGSESEDDEDSDGEEGLDTEREQQRQEKVNTDDQGMSRALRAALQEHARMLERVLAEGFNHNLAEKRQLRDAFENAYREELVAIYPGADWMERSAAWKDPVVEKIEGDTEEPVLPQMEETDERQGRRRSRSRSLSRRPSSRRLSLRKTLSFLRQ